MTSAIQGDTVAPRVHLPSLAVGLLIMVGGTIYPLVMAIGAVTRNQRTALFPAVPTFAESGHPGFDVSGWFAQFAPKGTPAPLLNQIALDVAAILKQPDMVAKIAELGAAARTTTPEDMTRRVSSDKMAWQRLLTEAKVKIQ